MALEKIRKEDCVLVIIDMQNDFVIKGAPIECGEPGRATIPKILELKEWAYKNEIPVIYTQEYHRADLSDFGKELEHEPPHCLEGTPGMDIVPELTPNPQDYRILKRRYSAFFQTDMNILLQGLKKNTLIICGVCTNICVYGTALDALQNGLQAVVVSDACAGTSPEYHEVFLRHVQFLVGDVCDVPTLKATL